jgi:hypothetical protein
VLKHIGSGWTEQEILSLVEQAMAWRATHCEPELFPEIKEAALTIPGTEFLGVRHTLTYDTLRHVATHCGLDVLEAPMLLDLAIIRLVEPSSKLRSLNLLDQYFGIQHSRRSFYRQLSGMLQHKDQVERIAVTYATRILQSDLAVVLYDVTTLYFESFDSDDLRIPGFSKDNMAQQPQVVLGLLVTRQGFPLGYELFPGNTFEGKTMLPILEAFVARHGVTTPTVVADAAKLSRPMLEELRRRGMSYIVGARLANSSAKIIEEVSTGLPRQDDGIIRVPSPHGDMICSFSTKRYKKDKANFEKMLTKAQRLVATGEPGKRAKFVKNNKGKDSYTIDQDLVARSERLLGVKGYCTNIPLAALFQHRSDRSIS